jgi:hypothetical protein
MKTELLYIALAQSAGAYHRCQETGNLEWATRHKLRCFELVKEWMPSGSGIDSGTEIDLDESGQDKLVFTTSYHHMDDGGCYAGWSDHKITVTPSFVGGFSIEFEGENRDDIQEYLGDMFHEALKQEIEVTFA